MKGNILKLNIKFRKIFQEKEKKQSMQNLEFIWSNVGNSMNEFNLASLFVPKLLDWSGYTILKLRKLA